MISKAMEKELNKRINEEIYSAYLYLAMASRAMEMGLKGCANWFQVQVKEEMVHAEKFYNYVLEQGARVVLEAIPKPPSTFKSPADLFEQTLEHEKLVTASINKAYSIAVKEHDYATETMLQWFITEQVEEEASASEVVQQLKFVGKDGAGLFMIDRELAARTFTPPAAAE